jgi:hypothetical protein
MCLSCGCMNPNTEKDDQITLEDLERAAEAQGTSVDEVVENINRTYQQAAS